jgi:hypothetical protein
MEWWYSLPWNGGTVWCGISSNQVVVNDATNMPSLTGFKIHPAHGFNHGDAETRNAIMNRFNGFIHTKDREDNPLKRLRNAMPSYIRTVETVG